MKALLTGAGGGIGAEFARTLRRHGYDLILSDRSVDLVARLAQELGAEVWPADLADRTSVEALCRRVAQCQDLQVVVSNAGIVVPGLFSEQSLDQTDRLLDINTRAPIALFQAALPAMRARGRGHLIATVSMAGLLAVPNAATYSASKFALRGFLLALSAELQGTGIAVSGIYPAAVDTPMLAYETANNGTALNFVGQPVSAARVAEGLDRALRKRPCEVYVPWSSSVASRVGASLPWFWSWVRPAVLRMGERGRERYLASKNS